jgi:hypothetical protein
MSGKEMLVPETTKPLMTRRQIGAYLRANGFPIGDSTLMKLGAPARGDGPPVTAWLGKRALHDPDAALAWARRRLRVVVRDTGVVICAAQHTVTD